MSLKLASNTTDISNFVRSSCCFHNGNEEYYFNHCIIEECNNNNEEIYVEDPINNLVDLVDKSTPKVVDFIKSKYYNKKFYIWAGQALLAVHPYENINGKVQDNDPSIRQVVAKACFNLEHGIGKPNQCLVISGDSGSGKTFTASIAINQIAENQTPKNNILFKAWSSAPLLTAFGNASTIHNCNSSRFGKLLQIQYQNGKIKGAFIFTYLLEKSRVSGPNRGESNFHIFNEILTNTEEHLLNAALINKHIVYKISPSSQNHHSSLYEETLKSMKALNITEMNEILRILSIILNLGNTEFTNVDDKFVITNDTKEFLVNACRLLQCTPGDLSNLFTKRLIAAKLRRDTFCYTSCFNIEECEDRRNCLMRFLYEKLFLWLVTRVNRQIFSEQKTNLLGILDIYGFESFSYNTFEQLCINYANERLQQYFVKNYLIDQLNTLNEEGELTYEAIDDIDYHERINLLDGTPSVFGILNEECLVKRYNTDNFVAARLSSTLTNYNHFIERANNYSTTFTIIHYAGNVEYDCKTMLTKNRDRVPEEMVTMLNNCRFRFVKTIIDSTVIEEANNGKTLLNKFKKSLDKLMSRLSEADVHYIKCLKPNLEQIPNNFDPDFFTCQLKNNGIFDILKLSLQNFTIRINRNVFQKRFPFLGKDLLTTLQCKIHFGRQLTYLNENTYSDLLKINNLRFSIAARTLQRHFRRYLSNRVKAITKIQRFYRNILVQRRNASYDRFLEVSWEQSNNSIPLNRTNNGLQDLSVLTPYRKTKAYVENLINHYPNEGGDRLSINLENSMNPVTTIHVKPIYFRKPNMISLRRFPPEPLRFHLRKTCIPFSHLPPKGYLPQGLPDILD